MMLLQVISQCSPAESITAYFMLYYLVGSQCYQCERESVVKNIKVQNVKDLFMTVLKFAFFRNQYPVSYRWSHFPLS